MFSETYRVPSTVKVLPTCNELARDAAVTELALVNKSTVFVIVLTATLFIFPVTSPVKVSP